MGNIEQSSKSSASRNLSQTQRFKEQPTEIFRNRAKSVLPPIQKLPKKKGFG